jgi:hypothetical protein
MSSRFALPAFAAYGIELEYMIVDAATADVAPLAEPLLACLQDRRSQQSSLTDWSNELVAHVVELKNPEPAPVAWPAAGCIQREGSCGQPCARGIRSAAHAVGHASVDGSAQGNDFVGSERCSDLSDL